MLRNLHVKNFALIDDAAVEFQNGLNVLTGETGAGKSILIDALGSVLGQRAGSEVIRRGADSAYTELVFSVEDLPADKLAALDVYPEDGQLILSRRILPGRNVYKINDETVTSARMRSLTELLLDIHGQHEHQSLLKSSKQMEILDNYAGEKASALKTSCAEAFRRFKKAEEDLRSFTLSEEERLRRADFLDFEIGEIENAAIRPGEKNELREEFRRLNHGEKIEQALSAALTLIGDTASDAVSRALGQLQAVSDFDSSLTQLSEQLITIEDLMDSLRRDTDDYLQENASNRERLSTVADRLDEINRLESKYGDLSNSGEEILAKRRLERQKLNEYEELRTEAIKARETAFNALTEACDKLSELRKEAAPALEDAVVKALKELNFLSVRFSIGLNKTEVPTANGGDSVQFLVALNPGSELEALAKVASGGELSRIMLAIKTILAGQDDIPTVIFDEIDTGISGKTAQMVGRKLKEISRYRQVLLITHLPQIAALADAHFGIEKWTDGVRTFTGVRLLDEADSVKELARLLGGERITESVLATARELKANTEA